MRNTIKYFGRHYYLVVFVFLLVRIEIYVFFNLLYIGVIFHKETIYRIQKYIFYIF